LRSRLLFGSFFSIGDYFRYPGFFPASRRFQSLPSDPQLIPRVFFFSGEYPFPRLCLTHPFFLAEVCPHDFSFMTDQPLFLAACRDSFLPPWSHQKHFPPPPSPLSAPPTLSNALKSLLRLRPFPFFIWPCVPPLSGVFLAFPPPASFWTPRSPNFTGKTIHVPPCYADANDIIRDSWLSEVLCHPFSYVVGLGFFQFNRNFLFSTGAVN